MFYLIWPPFCFPIQLWSLAPEIFFSSPTRLHPPKLLSCALWNVQLILKHCPVCFTLLPWHIPGCFPVRLFPLKSPRVRLFYSSFPKQRNSESAVENTVFFCFQTIFQQLSSKKKKHANFQNSWHQTTCFLFLWSWKYLMTCYWINTDLRGLKESCVIL